jgi:hypothetical protein
MGRITVPTRALLFAGILHAPDIDISNLTAELEECFGSILLMSEPMPFRETDYYESEMGKDLTRMWLGFDCLIERERLVDIKHECNSMESLRYSSSHKRKVNLDPGYITLGKVVLASTKNNQHRLYLGRGIFGEVTLRYRKKRYEPWEWTFADYKTETAVSFFIQLRKILKKHMNRD